MVRLLVSMPLVAMSLVMLARGSAHGACNPALIPDAVVARIDQTSIDAVLEPVGALVPEQLDLGDFKTSIDCGSFFEATTVTTHRGQIHLALSDLAVTLGPGALTIDIAGDIEAAANLDLQVCSLPQDNCDASVKATGVAIHAVVGLAVDACVPAVTVSAFTITVDDDNVDITLDRCGGYGFAFDLVDDWIRDDLLDYAKRELADYIPGLLQDQVSALTTDLLSDALTFQDVSFAAQPQAVSVDAGGLTLSFAALATPDVIADCAKGVAVADITNAEATTINLPENTSVGVSQRLAQNLATAAWQAGWMCLELSSVEPEVTTVLDSVLPGAKTAITVNVLQPPTLSFVASNVGAATLAMPAIRGSVRIEVPDDGDYSAEFTTGFSLAADVSIQPATNQIVLSPRDAQVAPVDVTLGATSIGFTEDSINRFVRGTIAPLFTTTLQELPMVSALFDASLVAISVKSLRTTAGAIIAEVGLAGIVGNDSIAPSTVVTGQIPTTCGPTLTLAVASTDDTADSTMIRHLVEVDGKRQRALTSGRTVSIGPMTAGAHNVRIAAVDLVGNSDTEGERFNVLVDATPPVIRFVDPPIGIIPANGTELTVMADDDNGVIESYDYSVAVVSRIAAPDEVFVRATQDFGTPIVLSNLPDAVTLRVTVTTHDLAGNAASSSASFAVLDHPTMGCASVSADWAVLVVLVGLLCRRRRCTS